MNFNGNLFGMLRSTSVRINALRNKHHRGHVITPRELLCHEKLQEVFGMSPDQAQKTLTPVTFDPKLLDGISDQVKQLCTVQHFGPPEVTEIAVKVLADRASFKYSETDDELEIAVLRSCVKVWYFQAYHRVAPGKFKKRSKRITFVEHDRSRKLLEDLRNLRFENYAKIMELLDLTLHFQPEVIVPAAKLTRRLRTMKVQALSYKLKTEASARAREELFNKTKEHFRQKILEEEAATASV